MRAGVYKKDPARIEIMDIPTPEADGQRAIIKVEAVGICGSDLTAYKEEAKPEGIIFGHEYAGTVVDPGANPDLKAGDRVIVFPTNHCEVCTECRRGLYHLCLPNVAGGRAQGLGLAYPGAFAEYVWALSQHTHKIPDQMSFEQATMVEPIAVCLRGVHQAGVFAGSRVLITGAGFIAVSAALMAKLAGATYIAVSARTPEKAQILLDQGIVDAVFDAKEPDHVDQLKAASGRGFDFALECTGSGDVLLQCVQTARPGGRICLLGISRSPLSVFMNTLIAVKELTLIGSMGYTEEEFMAAVDMIAGGKIDVMPYISKRIGLGELNETIKGLIDRSLKAVKVVLHPHG